MINGYCTIQEISKRWSLTPRRVRDLCAQGKIEGTAQFGKAWAIPDNAEKPSDGRLTTGKYKGWRNRACISKID